MLRMSNWLLSGRRPWRAALRMHDHKESQSVGVASIDAKTGQIKSPLLGSLLIAIAIADFLVAVSCRSSHCTVLNTSTLAAR